MSSILVQSQNLNNLNESFYLRIGSTWTFDSIYLFLITPLSFMGLVLNTISLFVITKVKTKNSTLNLYKYLKIYLINGNILCMIGTLSFLGYAPKYFKISLELPGRVFKCLVFNTFATTLYFFSNILNLLIQIDRLSIFIIKLKRIIGRIPAHKQMIIVFLFCVIVNLPLYFWNYVKQDEEFYSGAFNVSYLDSFTLCGKTEFYKSIFGKISSIISILIQDVLQLIIEISINTFTIIYYFRFIKKKLSLVVRNTILLVESSGNNSIENQNILTESQSDRKLIIMTIYLSCLSTISHLIALIRSIVLFNNSINRLVLFASSLVGIASICLNQLSNFFVLYYFNKNFRSLLKTKKTR